MHENRRFILAIGQIPPPMDGLAYITSEYVKLLKEDHDVKVINISPRAAQRGVAYHLSRAITVLLASFHLLLDAYRPHRACYMPCQSDVGLVYTIYLLAIARLLRYPTYLHHHNFGYINEQRSMMKVALRIGGPNVVHIFLCGRMRERFGQAYAKPTRTIIVSNRAFVPPQQRSDTAATTSALRIGLLSNLNREKGLYLFLDLLHAAREQGLDVRGLLAGPVRETADQDALEAAQRQLGDHLTYAGPLYGDEKTHFYQSIDVFVFPTAYVNEAQPTVLFEALAAGNMILSYERGCIASQVGENGLVIPQDQPFVPNALSWLRQRLVDGCAGSSKSIALRNMELHELEKARARSALSLSQNHSPEEILSQ